MSDPKNEYPKEVQEDILGILNYRHAQLFACGGRLHSMAYLATAYLNPGAYTENNLLSITEALQYTSVPIFSSTMTSTPRIR